MDSVTTMEKPQKSTRRFLILSLSLLTIVPLFLLSFALTRENYSVQKSLLRENQNLMANVALERIKNYIDEQRTLLLSTLKATNLTALNSHDQNNVLTMLLSSTVNKDYGKVFQDLILLDNKGNELVHVSRTEIFIESDLGNRSDSKEYKSVTDSNEIYYSPVYFDEQTGEPLITISIPMQNLRTAQFEGALIAHLRMRYMWDVISGIKVGRSGIAYILNDKGRVVAHRNPSLVLKETYFKYDKENMISSGLNGNHVIIAGKEMVLGNVKYLIVTELPVEEAFNYFKHSLLITAVFFLLTLMAVNLLLFLLFRKIVRPVESLAQTAQSISKGQLNEKAETGGNNEFSYLADSFNYMTSRLVETIISLEENIEERKKIQEELLLSLKEKEILLKEVHHRVKNNLQVIHSLLNMQLKKMKDRGDIEMIKTSQMRIKSISLIHEKLYLSQNVAYINFKNYISDLLELLSNSYKGYAYNVSFEVMAEEIFLDLDLAISCGFIINELVTNSLKYAFPENRKGKITIKINKMEDNHIEMIIKDDGIGVDPHFEFRKTDSIGLSLVTMFSELQLGGKIELNRENGTEFKITFKDRSKSKSK